MKNKLLIPILLFFQYVSAQEIDSFYLKQVDSLIQLSRMHSENQEIDKAFEINSIADLIVSTKIGIETISYANICFNKGRIHYFNQNYIEAEKWYSIAKSRIEVLVGKLHINYIATLVNLAVVYEVLNNYLLLQ